MENICSCVTQIDMWEYYDVFKQCTVWKILGPPAMVFVSCKPPHVGSGRSVGNASLGRTPFSTRPHSLIPKLATFQAHLGSRSCLLSDYRRRSSSSMRSVQWRVIDGVDDNANKENVSGIILGFIRENNYGDAPCGRWLYLRSSNFHTRFTSSVISPDFADSTAPV